MVREVPDNSFQRDGDDLVVRVRIRLEDALSEGKVDVPHLDGRILRVPLKEVCAVLPTLMLGLCTPDSPDSVFPGFKPPASVLWVALQFLARAG